MHPTEEQVQRIFEYRQEIQNQSRFAQRSANDEVISVPLKIHVVADSNGGNRYDLQSLLIQICELNQLYQQVGFYFHLLPEINYINDSRFIRTGGAKFDDIERMFGELLSRHYHYGALNIYYTLGTGLCGMAPFPSMTQRYGGRTGALMESSRQCAGPGTKTLAHELGHHFDLLHPFQGWDTKDARYSEYVTRAVGIRNCETAGDGFCDTQADVLDFTCPYTGTHTDLRGDRYNPDVSLIMSYHRDACQNKFSDQQIAHMRNVIYTDTARKVYLENQIDDFTQISTTALLLPENQSDVPFDRRTLFIWEAVEDADAYLFTVSTGSGTIIVQSFVHGSNSFEFTFKPEDRGRTFNWTVIPVKFSQPCSTPSETRRVRIVAPTTGILNNESVAFSVYPNPVNGDKKLTIRLNNEVQRGANEQVKIKLTALNGQTVQESTIRLVSEQIDLQLHEDIASGVYFLHFQKGDVTYQSKLIVQ